METLVVTEQMASVMGIPAGTVLSVRKPQNFGASLPPRRYDIEIDEWRTVTQADVAHWVALEKAYGDMVQFLRKRHEELVHELKKVRNCAPEPEPTPAMARLQQTHAKAMEAQFTPSEIAFNLDDA
jgi:hypothetical protein